MAASILVVEDDPAVALALEVALKGEGYLPLLAATGDKGLEIGLAQAPDLLILDVRLPGIDGFELLRRLRAGGSKAPVIILTARDEEVDTILGLELGADDYMTKPFRVRELLTRVKSHLRRAYGDLADALGGRIIRADELLIDLERRRVSRAGKKISLTPTEFEILRLLAEKPGRVFSRRDLLERVRDYDAAISGDEKTINVHVSHLRDKVEEDPSNPRFVMTVRGVGYAFADRSERGERSGS
ncbi:MAG: DNA-binding response regulator [Candidatus Limnocylindrus sp. ZSMar2m-chloro-G89]|jgi:two-component system alkaline phosphatase synthesis response regulator PhoP|nr:MAG: DNA-binding response regulator [Candidatus Limnocylindrus sp.]RLT48720.1 MAG: DNA-binding response regulator [Candidatus Limnocylindrus sp. ZSMar2m-chloro-G89]